jgi:hypothetical protein
VYALSAGFQSNEAPQLETLTSSTVMLEASSGSAELARFFPGVRRVRIRAVLKPRRSLSGTVSETVIVEYAGARQVIFLSALPLEFDDLVQLQPAQGKANSDGRVIAVQYHHDHKAVAVQLANADTSWVNRP